MAVYVDNAFIPHNNRVWSHLMADSLEELEAFARKLGLPRGWLQGDHYDVTAFIRAKAVNMGAKQITVQESVRLRQKLRNLKS